MKVQKFLPWDNSSVTNYKAWAQGFGDAMAALGWVRAGDPGQVTWANVATTPSSLVTWPNAFNWRGAFSAGTIYAAGDLVQSGGNTYMCNTALNAETLTSVAVSGGTATYNGSSMHVSPGDTVVIAGFANAGNNGTFTVNTVTGAWGSATSFTVTTSTQVAETHAATVINGTLPQNNVVANAATSVTHHWVTHNYEIWQSNGPLSATNPVFLKLIYGAASSGSNGNPALFFQVGTAQSNGVIGGNMFNSGIILGVAVTSTGGQFGSLLLENDFCGDADKVSMAVFLGAQQQKGGNTGGIIAIDRAHDSQGGDLDTYITVATVGQQTGGSVVGHAQMLYKPGSGSVCPSSPITGWPIIVTGQISNAFNGQAAAMPLFFLPGYMANPMLGAIAMAMNDIPPLGSLFNVVLYGTSHTFMSVEFNTGPQSLVQGAIQWE